MNKIFLISQNKYDEYILDFRDNKIKRNLEKYDFEIINKNKLMIKYDDNRIDFFYTNDSYLYFNDLSYLNEVEKVTIYHPEWTDQIILNNITKRLFRIGLPTEEASFVKNDNLITVQWDYWGYEYFEIIDKYNYIRKEYKESLEKKRVENDKKNYVFIHICHKEEWKVIFEELMGILQSSGLYIECDRIYLGIVGENIEIDYFMKYNKIEIMYIDDNIYQYEILTINYIKKYCSEMEEESNILYLHTKGIRKAGNNECTESWRKMMEYFLVTKYRECLEYLTEYDSIGCNLINTFSNDKLCNTVNGTHNYHYSGNYWWSKSSHIKKLKKLEEDISEESIDSRCRAENWICSLYPNMKIGIVYEDFTNTHPYHRYIFENYRSNYFLVKPQK